MKIKRRTFLKISAVIFLGLATFNLNLITNPFKESFYIELPTKIKGKWIEVYLNGKFLDSKDYYINDKIINLKTVPDNWSTVTVSTIYKNI